MSWGGGDARLGLLMLGSRARSSGGVLGVALYTERRAARAGVMAADLGTSVLARAACLGGVPALLLAGVALWVRPTELGALARVVGDADLGRPATWARAILGGRERVPALNAPSREVWRVKESPRATL